NINFFIFSLHPRFTRTTPVLFLVSGIPGSNLADPISRRCA
ncbi:hypothetical protein ABIB68_008237, partial [Bradyrhizobium sp. F1.2.2]